MLHLSQDYEYTPNLFCHFGLVTSYLLPWEMKPLQNGIQNLCIGVGELVSFLTLLQSEGQTNMELNNITLSNYTWLAFGVAKRNAMSQDYKRMAVDTPLIYQKDEKYFSTILLCGEIRK